MSWSELLILKFVFLSPSLFLTPTKGDVQISPSVHSHQNTNDSFLSLPTSDTPGSSFGFTERINLESAVSLPLLSWLVVVNLSQAESFEKNLRSNWENAPTRWACRQACRYLLDDDSYGKTQPTRMMPRLDRWSWVGYAEGSHEEQTSRQCFSMALFHLLPPFFWSAWVSAVISLSNELLPQNKVK